MIKNERQYRFTRTQIAKFEAALNQLALGGNKSDRLRELEEKSLASQLEELRSEAEEYEQLRSGKRTPIHIQSWEDLPRALVRIRIAAGLSQKDLALRLGLKEQQVQRYEATDYSSASMTRIYQVAEALGADLAGELTYSA